MSRGGRFAPDRGAAEGGHTAGVGVSSDRNAEGLTPSGREDALQSLGELRRMLDFRRRGRKFEEGTIRDLRCRFVRPKRVGIIEPKRRPHVQGTTANRTTRMISTLRLGRARAAGVVERVRDQVPRHYEKREKRAEQLQGLMPE
ncbi:MAG: hypothetical protein ABI540_00775 [Spartobacteria bacterium]